MDKHFVSWSLCSVDRKLDDRTRRSLWIYEINAEWKLKCTCKQNNRHKLSSIEFHRKSLAGESIISGFLEIYAEGKQLLLKKRFICLLQDGCLLTRIHLQYPLNTAKSLPKASFVIGEVTMGGRIEASNNLTELVHLTKTDNSSLEQLSSDMENLLFKKPFADVSLKCRSVTIPVHKIILLARSPVFEAMLNCPIEEVMVNIVIDNVKVPVLQAMLEYMYTGKIEEATKLYLVFDLVIAANKYQIRCLESVCNEYVMSNMSMKNVASILHIADFVSPDLTNFAMDFMCNQCTDYSALEKTKDWIRLKNEKPALVLEICSAIVKSQERKLKMQI